MANTIRLKRSSLAGKVPATTDLALGEIAVNTTDGKLYIKKSDGGEFIVEVGPVVSVAGRVGAVALVKADVGLGSVDNTSDAAKPVSTATQSALDGKAASIHSHAIADVTSLQASLDAKAPLASPALTGTPTAPTQTQGNNSTRIATTAYVDTLGATKAASAHTHAIADVTSLQTTLDAKAALSHTHTAAQISDATAAGRSLLTAADAAAQRTGLGLGALATLGSVGTSQIDNLSVTTAKIADASVGIAKLGVDITAAGKALLDDADAAAQRTTLGLGTGALRNISVGTTAPASPAVNDLWVDTN